MMGAVSPRKLTPDLLLRAYAAGLFPMAEHAGDHGLFWVDPERRGIFPLDGLQVSRSLRKVVRSGPFEIAFDRDFAAVIDGCAAASADRTQTWINATIRQTYGTLFALGHVHTVEAWIDGHLVGGLYGVSLGRAFFGESMFHRASDASKVCLVHLAAALNSSGFQLLDAQFLTPHLATLGAIEISREDYHRRLARALESTAVFPSWRDDLLKGSVALDLVDQARAGHLPAGS